MRKSSKVSWHDVHKIDRYDNAKWVRDRRWGQIGGDRRRWRRRCASWSRRGGALFVYEAAVGF